MDDDSNSCSTQTTNTSESDNLYDDSHSIVRRKGKPPYKGVKRSIKKRVKTVREIKEEKIQDKMKHYDWREDFVKIKASCTTHQCLVCSRILINNARTALFLHKSIHSGEMHFSCLYCSRRFRRLSDRSLHENNVHLEFMRKVAAGLYDLEKELLLSIPKLDEKLFKLKYSEMNIKVKTEVKEVENKVLYTDNNAINNINIKSEVVDEGSKIVEMHYNYNGQQTVMNTNHDVNFQFVNYLPNYSYENIEPNYEYTYSTTASNIVNPDYPNYNNTTYDNYGIAFNDDINTQQHINVLDFQNY